MAREPSEPLPPGVRLDDKYVVVRHIKTGGMGAVYEVEHSLLGKHLAAKLLLPELALKPELLERFRREARAASATGHENIVEVTDLGETRGQVPFLVMELLSGRTLGAELKAGRLSPERAVHVTRQILSALKAAHARGIVHRDLKPENIFLIQRAGDPDFVKVLDFGIAKMLDEVPGDELTRTGQVVGTPTYMAPEQARGAGVDRRTDLYATGAILYRMVTGERPFVGPNFNSLLFAIAQGNPTPPQKLNPDVSPHLEAVILRAMAVDPRARFQSAEELDEALGEEDRTLEKRAPRPSPSADANDAAEPEWSQRSVTMMGRSRPAGKVRRAISRAMTLAIAAGMVVVLGGGTWLVVRRVLRIRAAAEMAERAREARARVLATRPPPVVQLTVEVEPKSARLTVDGAQVGGPMVAVVKDGKRHVLRAEADGYRPEERAFLASGDQKLVVHLRRGHGSAAKRSPKGPHPIGAPDGTDPDQPDPSQMKTLEKLINKLGQSTDF